MVQHKAQLKKQQKRGVDFKKIKRKIGRKLPPPKNTTNTQVKSKAIVLPEQSLASEKAGLAVSKKGLTLKELLQQTSHHNAKVRRALFVRLALKVQEKNFNALKENQGTFISLMMAYVFNAMTHLSIDVRLMAFKFFDLVVQHYPASFSMYAEKIIQQYKEILHRNQFNLHDKGKLKSVLAGLAYCLSLLPCNKTEDNSSTINVLFNTLMLYDSCRPCALFLLELLSKLFPQATTDRRILHAFEPEVHVDRSGFSVTANELKGLLPILVGGLQDFMPSVLTMPTLEAQSFDCVLSILKSIDLVVKFFVNGRGRSGPQLIVSPPYNRSDQDALQMVLKKLFTVFPLNPTKQSSEKDDNRYFVLNVIITEVFFCLIDWSAPPSVFLDKFLVFIVDVLSEKAHSGKAFFQKHSLPLIPFIPKLIMQVDDTWKLHILQAFTEVFKKCDPESSMKLVCLSAIEEMLFPKDSWLSTNTSDPEIVDFQITWIREIPLLLTALADKCPSSSKVVLRLHLHLGKCVIMNSPLSQEFDNMQYSLTGFYSTCHDGVISYGPFMKLPREIQEFSICCLYYFSFLDPSLLQSLAACCLCRDLEPFLLLRFLEVLNSAYRAGHLQIADYISFLITLLCRYEVFPENSSVSMEKCRKSNSGVFRSVTSTICSCLSQIGDDHLVFKILEGAVIDQISNKPPLENTCALLRMIITLDSKPSKLSEESISKLGYVIPGYLVDVVSGLDHSIREEEHGSSNTIRTSRSHYYVLPCFLLFSKSKKLFNNVLSVISSISGNDSPIVDGQNSLVMLDHMSRITAVVRILLLIHEDVRILPSYKEEIDSVLHKTFRVMVGLSSETVLVSRHNFS
ncbi:armadillo-like helical domain-containing protein [Tanacetum coccineum]